MTQSITLSEAKAHLAGLVHAAEAGEVVHISRHGKPVAVLLSEQAYADLKGQRNQSRLWESIAQWRAIGQASNPDDWPLDTGVEGQSLSGDQEVNSWRDRATGREVSLG